jgi:queuine/archaeosine tRNA-ribosyltransferase
MREMRAAIERGEFPKWRVAFIAQQGSDAVADA